MGKTIKVKKLRKILKSLPKNYDIQLGTNDANKVISVTNAKGFWIDEEEKVIVLADCTQK